MAGCTYLILLLQVDKLATVGESWVTRVVDELVSVLHGASSLPDQRVCDGSSSGKGPVVFQNRSVKSWEHVNLLDIEKVKLEVGFQKTHFSVRTSLWPMKPCVCRKGSPTWYPEYSGRRMDQKKHGIRLELLFFDQRKENSVSRQPHHYMRLYFPG